MIGIGASSSVHLINGLLDDHANTSCVLPAIKSVTYVLGLSVTPIRAPVESQGSGGRRTRATLSRYGQFRHNLRSLFDHNLQTRRTNYAQI